MTLRACALAGLAFTLVIGAGLPSAMAQPRELPATLVTLTGKAETYKKGDTAWKPAELRAELGEGDGIRTSPSVRATLRTGGGHAIRLAALSQVFFLPSEGSEEDQPVRVRMDRGWLWVAVAQGAYVRPPVEVRIGPTRVSVRNGGVGLRLGRDGAVLVRVYHGLVTIAGTGAPSAWERVLGDDQELLVGPSGAPADVRKLSREPVEAPWVLWNEEQDYAAYGGKSPR
jgi:hypothetical protein